jgi:acyl-CoA reductase-like NAD-dependent aldehyde dehydrogenase
MDQFTSPPPKLTEQEPVSNSTIVVRNPATREKIGVVAVASPVEVRDCVRRAREAQPAWESTSYRERARRLYRFRDLLIDEQERLADILTSETGKPRGEFYGNELFYMCDAIGYWGKYGERYLHPRKIHPHLFMFKTKRVTSTYYPLGVVGMISPWNFPLVLSAGDAVPALMAGNAVINKPSELTPLTALLVVELARKAGLPEGILQVVTGGAETGQALIDHVDMIAFTGSVEVGKEVMRRAADRLIPVSLELGGKDPAIVLQDADLERAANACVWGAFMNSGQVCTSIERVYVEAPVYGAFLEKVVEKTRRLRQGPSHEEVELGSMSSEAQFNQVASHVADALAQGAQALTGGRAAPNMGGLYYEPTVLVDVNHDMAVIREETFGPVLPIIKVRDAEEALVLANESRYGLDACIFTRDRKMAARIADRLRTGTVCINDGLVNYVIIDAPMGGVKDSGFSRRHGPQGIRKYCHQKTIVADRFGLKREFPWFPASRKRTEQMRRLIRLLWRSGWKNKFRFPRPTVP